MLSLEIKVEEIDWVGGYNYLIFCATHQYRPSLPNPPVHCFLYAVRQFGVFGGGGVFGHSSLNVANPEP